MALLENPVGTKRRWGVLNSVHIESVDIGLSKPLK